MKNKMLLFAAISLCFIRVDLLWGQGANRVRLGMASLFLGDPNGVRLSGGLNNPTTYWGKDSANLHGGVAHVALPVIGRRSHKVELVI
jgi:hypothetical protein